MSGEPRTTGRCGCNCACHVAEAKPDWPGSCAGCCEPGDNCDCGRALSRVLPDVLGALERYGRHDLDCDYQLGYGMDGDKPIPPYALPCSCGFAEVRARTLASLALGIAL